MNFGIYIISLDVINASWGGFDLAIQWKYSVGSNYLTFGEKFPLSKGKVNIHWLKNQKVANVSLNLRHLDVFPCFLMKIHLEKFMETAVIQKKLPVICIKVCVLAWGGICSIRQTADGIRNQKLMCSLWLHGVRPVMVWVFFCRSTDNVSAVIVFGYMHPQQLTC